MAQKRSIRPTPAQKAWLRRGLEQPGGKLPLFDLQGQEYASRTIKSCIQQGWAEPWFNNPLKPNWLVCKLTDSGRLIALLPDRPRTAKKTRDSTAPAALRRRALQSQMPLI